MTRNFDLILTIVNKGFAEQAMEAAKKAGAQGGTIISARGSGIHEAERLFGFSIQPEKDIVLILIKHQEKSAIMKAITQGAGLTTEGKGLSFSLPVDDVAGIVHMMSETKEIEP